MPRRNLPYPTINGVEAGFGSKTQDANYPNRIQHIISWIRRFFIRTESSWDKLNIQEASSPKFHKGPLDGRGRNSSRSRSTNGMPIREARGRNDLARPRFDIRVEKNGYAWWYIDGISKDGTQAISIIGFIGSVFSPWYYWAGRKNPQDHACINVALY